ncbi:MAG: YqgE/AlgH family protein [Ferruginibacter sp.]
MIEPAPGILLIADPFLKDPNFGRTVVFLCEHQAQGSFGFVLSRPLRQTLDELVTDIPGCKMPVYYGGPVQQDTLHFLHQYPDLIPEANPVAPGIFWGGDFETVCQLLRANRLDAGKIKFFVGYSGWGDGQLGDELKEKSWLTVPANRKLVFNTLYSEIWKGSLRELGGEYAQLAHYPIDPQLN